MKETNFPKPQDEKLFLFQLSLKLSRLPIVRNLISFFNSILLYISPNVPISLHDSLKNVPSRRALIPGIAIGLFFCFGITAILTIIAGTFNGNDPNRIYFIKDWQNIVNYTVLCPLYIGLSSHLISIVINSWPSLSNLPLQNSTSLGLPRRSLSFSIFLIIIFSTGFTVNYIKECIDPSVYPKIGWWVDSIGANGERIMGIVGLYYTILNFLLMTICLTALTSFLSIFYLCIRLGKTISKEPPTSSLTFEALKRILSHFTESYLVAKILTATLMLNAYTWKSEKPLASFNMTVMGGLLAFFGVFYVSIPRYYIELEWFKYKTRKAIFNGDTASINNDDIRPFGTKIAAHIIDVLIISGFILTFFTWNS